MKKGTFLFSLLLSVATLALHAQKPESGTYTISNVANSSVTLADNQFLGIGPMNDDGTYQTYSLKMNAPGTTSVFDVYGKLDEMLATAESVMDSNLGKTTLGGISIKTDILAAIRLLSNAASKINVEPYGVDTDGNAMVRFKVGVPTVPNFMDNMFKTNIGQTGPNQSGYIWNWALNQLSASYESDPIGKFIAETAKAKLKPEPYTASMVRWYPATNPVPEKYTNYYICNSETYGISFIAESEVNSGNMNNTLWILKGSANPEKYASDDFYVANKGNGMYISNNAGTAQPDLNDITSSNSSTAEASIELGKTREGENVYQINKFQVGGKNIFDYITSTVGSDDATEKAYLKIVKDNRNTIPVTKYYYGFPITRYYYFYYEEEGKDLFYSNFGFIENYEIEMLSDWKNKAFGHIKMQDNGDETVSFYFDVPANLTMMTALTQTIKTPDYWEYKKSATLDKIADATEKAYVKAILDKITPSASDVTRYYIVANENNEFDVVQVDDATTLGDNGKWQLITTKRPDISGYYRIENTSTGNILELHGLDASTVKASSDATASTTNASTVINVQSTAKNLEYEIGEMKAQGIDFINDLNAMLGEMANIFSLSTPSFMMKPTSFGADTYVVYFDAPALPEMLFNAALAKAAQDAEDPTATAAFFANVKPGKRYSVAQVPGTSNLVAVEGDTPSAYNTWKMKKIDNENEIFTINFAEKMSIKEGAYTYYYSTFNADFDYTIPNNSQIKAAYVISDATSASGNGSVKTALIGGPGTQIPANTPVILESLAAGSADNNINIIDEITEFTTIPENYLAGTLLEEAVEENGRSRANIRVFTANSKGVVGFYKYSGEKLTKNKAYLDLSSINSSLVNTYYMCFDEMGPTGIEEIEDQQSTNNVIYDIQGRKVKSPSKGLYIINGKKVLIK